MLWLVRILIQNGLALFATWLTVASTITLADVIIYKDSPGLNKAMFRGEFITNPYHCFCAYLERTD